MGNSDLAQSLTDAGETINASPTFDGALEAVARLAPSVVPGIDHAGVMLTGRRGRIRGEVATDALARDLDRVQIEQRHGPGLCAMEQTQVVVVERLQHDQRWPETHGALNLYCTSRQSFQPESVRAARLYGTHVGWALRHVRLRQHLEAVLDSRHLIGLACGLVMQQHRVDHVNALSYLARVSQTRNVKMRELARDLIVRVEKEHAAALPDTDLGLHVLSRHQAPLLLVGDRSQVVSPTPGQVPGARSRNASTEGRWT